MAALGVVPLRADFTKSDPVISEWLKRYGKAGVPMYVVIPVNPARDLWLLPEVLTPGLVVEALREAAAPGGASGS